MNRRVWMALSMAAGLAALWLFARAAHAPYLSDDSYQYLDAARNFTSGECLCTHLAHFDEQVAYGRFPVPFTHFPPAYPLLLAAASRIGVSLETAGFLISAAGFLLTVWLIWDLGLNLEARPWAVGLAAIIWIANSGALLDAATVGTEAVFAACLAAVGAIMVRDLRSEGRRPAYLLVLGCLAGTAYDLRYAGLFVLPVAVLYVLWRWRRTPAARWWAIGGMAFAIALPASAMMRNFVYTGSWRGGNNNAQTHGLRTVFAEFFKSYYHLIFGDAAPARADLWATLFSAAFAVMLLLMLRAWRSGQYARMPKFAPSAMAWLSALVLAYTFGVALADIFTIARDMTRYDRPIYPLMLALAAPLLSVALKGRTIIAGVVAAAAILVIQSRSLAAQPRPAPYLSAQEALSREMQPGTTGRAWLLDHMPPGSVLVATDGQSVQYLLHRNVVSITPPEATTRAVDSNGFRDLMTRFHARYLLLFPAMSEDDAPEQTGIPFLHDLAAAADPPPPWLRQDGRNSEVAIYECGACVQ